MRKSMKILAATCTTILLTGSMLTTAMPNGEKRLERMAEHLQLSEDQTNQVRQIFQEQRQQTQEKLQTVLTAEQFINLKERGGKDHHKNCDKQR